MKLYIYEHCPFCIRARMIFALRNVAVQNSVLLNDDESTPIGLIGAKQVPILQKDDGSHMGESLDIVHYINELSGNAPLQTARPEVQAWLEHVGTYYNALVAPRHVQMGFAEFATQSAIDYFVNKKQAVYGNFAENLSNTAELLARLHADLQDLNALILSETWFNGTNLSLEDIMIFPVLRNITMVKDLNLPDNLLKYAQNMAQQSQLALYFERAL